MCSLKLPFAILLTDAESGRAMPKQMTGRVVKPTQETAQPVYAVSEPTLGPAEQVIADVTGPSVGLADLEAMLKHLLPAVPAQAPPPRSAPTDIEAMLKRLLPGRRHRHRNPVWRRPQGLGYDSVLLLWQNTATG